MTELVFILDRSGSMSGLEADTIGGFNSMLAQQKREAGEALVSTVLFANDSTVIHDRLPLCEVPPLTEKEYFTRGCTALLDAVKQHYTDLSLEVYQKNCRAVNFYHAQGFRIEDSAWQDETRHPTWIMRWQAD